MSSLLKKELIRDVEECINMSSKINKNCVAIQKKVEGCDEKMDVGYLKGIKKRIDLLHKILSGIFW